MSACYGLSDPFVATTPAHMRVSLYPEAAR